MKERCISVEQIYIGIDIFVSNYGTPLRNKLLCQLFRVLKGQLISNGLFGVLNHFDQKTNEIFLRISALFFKKSSNQKILLYDDVK